ncbi:TetR/AcrR family transcriptional regulator [Nonomuraea africana]|uniref:AcrR family transcriptional regulator n=1 Tax=Nonomuraea africana TaxID=46171 RepID=A0ABR9K9Z6_9ACTN|nr:TetR/AcrR family transcriptional regulator [Nonomuraea africana]MBE1558715.1 AcrR family transcriptional regulator [Nonomuraea africana]
MAVTEEQIVTAAIHHLNAHPTASMAELAEAAGVSRATLHRHFSSRDDLLIALGRRALERWEQVQDTVDLAAAAQESDPARLTATLRDLLVSLVDMADEHGFALTDPAMEVDPGLLRKLEELEGREMALFGAAQRAGVLRADLPVRWVSNAVYGLLVAVRESLRRGDVARRDAAGLLVDTFLRGMGR